MDENNLRRTFMSLAKSDERNPVICPSCGLGMRKELCDDEHWRPSFYDPDSGGKPGHFYVCDCGWSSPVTETSEEAYSLAMLRTPATPPNRPMDYKTIYNMTDREPVWRVDKQDDVIVLGGYNAWRKYDAVRYLYFAANPSPADIEAARMKGCGKDA